MRDIAGPVHFCSVLHAVQLVEAYVPGLREMQVTRYEEVARAVLNSLGGADDHAVVVILPEDEVMLLFVTAHVQGSTLQSIDASAFVQRIVDAQLIFPYDDREI